MSTAGGTRDWWFRRGQEITDYLAQNADSVMRLFISYATVDAKKMQSLKKAINIEITDADIIVVADQRSPLTPLGEKVKSGIENATHFIPIMTRSSIANQWVNQEIGYAQAQSRNIQMLPVVENQIITELKGFVHAQMDLPFSFIGDRYNRRREASNFTRCCRGLIQYLRQTSTSRFKTSIFPKKVRKGESYQTTVEFTGEIRNGFFDNLVQHQSQNFKTWNWDPESIPNNERTTPGKLNGRVNVSRTYEHPTIGWPPGKYKIYVRLYSHLTPGEPRRQVVREDVHEFEVVP